MITESQTATSNTVSQPASPQHHDQQMKGKNM